MLYELYDRIIRADIDSYKRGKTIFSTTNCPNCGAPITGRQCEYCGTVFYAMKHFDHIESERKGASHIFTVNEMRELCGLPRIDMDISEWCAPINPVEAYKQGEIVRYHGVLRRSLINCNVYPPIHDSVWETVENI